MAQGSNITSRGALPLPTTRGLGTPAIRGGAAGTAQAAAQLGKLAGELNLVGGQLFEQDIREQEEEQQRAGQQAGIEAGRTGGALERQDSGLFGRRQDTAFNRAAEVGYEQGLQVKIEQQRQQLELQHEADPDGFMESWGKFERDLIKRAPPQMRQAITANLELQGGRADSALAKQKQGRVATQAALNVRLRIDQLRNLAGNAARQAGNPAGAAEHLTELQASVDQAGAAGWLSDGEAAAILIGARDEAFSAGYMGAFERAPSAAALQDFLEDETPELGQGQKDVLAGRMQAILARQESAARAAHAQLGREVAAVEKALEAGLAVEGLDGLRQRAAGTEYELGLDVAASIAEQTRAIAQLPPAEVDARLAGVRQQLEELRKIEIGPDQAAEAAGVVARLEAFEQVLTKNKERTAKAIADGRVMDRAAELGVVELAPLDFSSGIAFGQTLAGRVEAAALAEEHFGTGPGNVLTGEEVTAFAELLQAGAAQTEVQASVIGMMEEQLGRARMGATLEQVAKKGAPTMAFAAGAAPALRNEMLRGRAILADNPGLAPTVDNEAVRALVSGAYGGVLDGNPFTLRQATEAARWLYANRRFAAGDLTGVLDEDAMTDALTDAVGGVVEWSNDSGMLWGDTSRMVAPRSGMTSGEFQGLMDGLTDADLAAGGQQPLTDQGQPVSADLLRVLGKLRSVGDGLYAVTIGEFGLIDQNGKPYELNLGAVLEARGS